jgi:hypothetical protein
MATRLSAYFRKRRLDLGLRPGEVARRIGYKSIVGCANKLCQFELTGSIRGDLLLKIAAVLEIDTPTIERLIEEDRREHFEAWTEWANQPIRPYLVIKAIPGVFCTNQLPDKIIGDQEAMEKHASDLAKRWTKMVFLILSRRISVIFGEDGNKRGINEASPDQPNGPYMRLKGSNRPFLLTGDSGRIGVQPLNQPTRPQVQIYEQEE